MENINNVDSFAALEGFSLNRIVYFTAVVETGSFTAAAGRLGITKAVVSQQVARLEADFNIALLIRTTRRVRLTEAGEAFYRRCVRILKEAENAFGELTESSGKPSGALRLTAPYDYGIEVIVPALARFTAQYPDCTVEVSFSDSIQDINASQFDLSVRMGWLTESHLQGRKIGTFAQKLVAATGLAPRLAGIKVPADLHAAPLIANTALKEPARFSFSRPDGATQVVSLRSSMQFNATLAVHRAALAGGGVAVLPDYVVAGDIEAGRLFEVLPDWRLPAADIYIVYPTTSYRPAKVSAFVELFTRMLREE